MRKRISIALLFQLVVMASFAQHPKCVTMQHLERSMQKHPELRSRIQQSELLIQQSIPQKSTQSNSIITIPVVVHVVWKQSVQNISDAQILSQIAILNKDFRLLNSDSLTKSHPFWPFTADTQIEFCLATKDPSGNATTGITRTQTSITEWDDNNSDDLKNSAKGGKNNWDPTKYLNLYVANLQSTVLGFATFPDELISSPELDGVAIRPEAFGSVGTAGSGGFDVNDLGRTATHEVGHWLFLRHIWGDEPCGNDFVGDTPIAESENYNCPNFPFRPNNSCGANANGEMYMNYMDYVDDACMKMFTAGQKQRMQSAISQLRPGLLTANACNSTTGLHQEEINYNFNIFPNPSSEVFYLDFNSNIPTKISIVNLLGMKVMEYENVSSSKFQIVLKNKLQKGIYFIDVDFGNNNSIKKKIIIE